MLMSPDPFSLGKGRRRETTQERRANDSFGKRVPRAKMTGRCMPM